MTSDNFMWVAQVGGFNACKAACAREGLFLTSWISRGRQTHAHGFRVFPGTEERDHFAGGHLSHCRTFGEVYVFLDGYKAGKKAAG